MLTATRTGEGQTTVPKEVRDHLRLKAGDRLRFVIDEHGRVLIDPARVSIKELRGILPEPDRAVNLEETDEAIAQEAAEWANRR